MLQLNYSDSESNVSRNEDDDSFGDPGNNITSIDSFYLLNRTPCFFSFLKDTFWNVNIRITDIFDSSSWYALCILYTLRLKGTNFCGN